MENKTSAGTLCSINGFFGSKLHFIARKGTPFLSSVFIALTVNQILQKVFDGEPVAFDLMLSDLICTVTAPISYYLVDKLTECCWKSNPNDDKREFVRNDYGTLIPAHINNY